MKRTPVAHIILPAPRTTRPIPEFVWDAAFIAAQSRGLDVEVLMPVPHRALRRLQSIGRAARGNDTWTSDIDRALCALKPTPTLIPYVPIPQRSIESATAAITAHLIARPRAGRPAVIQGSFLDSGGYVAATAGRAIGVASIAVAHGTDTRAARGDDDMPKGRVRRARAALRRATEVIAVSHALARDLARFGRRTPVLPFTARPEQFGLQSFTDETPIILFVGRIERAKGVDLLLEAFAKLDDRDVRLRLIGRTTGDIDVAAEAARLGISDRVEYLGELEQTAVAVHYGKARCLALPSRAEGLPCVLVEALLTGRPVVATDVGGVRDLVDDSVGRLVEPDDATELARGLREVLATAFDPQRLRAHALPLSWADTGPKLEALTWRLITCA